MTPQSFVEDLGNGIALEMVAIPGGTFLMGSPPGKGWASEYPQHQVTVSEFLIGKYPVTQVQWKAVMGYNPSYLKGDDLPVECVTWDSAVEFCEQISKLAGKAYRLPTEAEWEYSCRAGTNGKYCFGDDEDLLNQYAWHGRNSLGKTHAVGRKTSNAWGLHDMHGNVWEWCHDRDDGTNYANSSNVDPQGPTSGEYRVWRGGSWLDDCYAALRGSALPDTRRTDVGFRVACVAKSQSTQLPTAAPEDAVVRAREVSAGAPGKIGDVIIALLKNSDPDAQSKVVEALAGLGAAAVGPLTGALDGSDRRAQCLAAEALGKIGDTRAVEPLIAALISLDKQVQLKAAEALGRIGDKRAVEPLIRRLKDYDMDIRSVVSEALGEIGDARAVEPLILYAGFSDERVKRIVSEALSKIR